MDQLTAKLLEDLSLNSDEIVQAHNGIVAKSARRYFPFNCTCKGIFRKYLLYTRTRLSLQQHLSSFARCSGFAKEILHCMYSPATEA